MANRCSRFVLVVAAWPLATSPLAAGVDIWTPVGPPGSSQLTALAVDALAPEVLYAGFPSERQVWKTSNGGGDWVRASAGIPVTAGNILGLAVHPADSNLVFAATSLRQIYRSSDGGASWALAEGPTPSTTHLGGMADFAALQGDPISVYVSFAGAGGSLFESTDGGATWERRDPVLDVGVRSLVSAASSPGALYAALGARGIYRSTDGGATWALASSGLPFAAGPPYDQYNVTVVAADPSDPLVLYTVSNRDRRVYRSTDGGDSWGVASAEAPGFYALEVLPATGDLLAVGNDYLGASPTYSECLFRSTDGGVTFANLTAGHRNARHPTPHPTLATTVYAHLDEGLHRTTDGGTTWSPAQGTMRAYDGNVTFVPSLPGTYWAGFWASMGKTTDGGASFETFAPSAALPVGERFAIHPGDPATVITDSLNGCYNRPDGAPCLESSLIRTTDGGASWQGVPNPLYPDGWGLSQAWGLAFDPADPAQVYALGVGDDPGVYRSEDGGQTFAVAGGIGTPLWPNALVVAPTTPTTLYMGTSATYGWAPGIWRSTDHADSWQAITSGLPASPNVRSIVLHPSDLQRLYIAVQAAVDAGFYTSTDGGGSWTRLAGAGLPAGVGGLALTFDPTAPQVLWGSVSGAELGLYRSDDGGASWRSFSTGLDSLLVWNLTVDPNDHHHVLAGTRAGVWELTVVPRVLTVTRTGLGSGSVVSVPAGIDCGALCTAEYTADQVVTLSASAAPGSVFTGWSGEGCSGTGPCVVAMSVDRSVTARFSPNGPDLEVTLAAAPPEGVAGQSLDVTARVENLGNVAASGAMVTVAPPLGATSVVAVAASQGSCFGTAPVICSLGGLAAGAVATVAVELLPASAGTLTTRATVAAVTDVDPGNNVAGLATSCKAARPGPVGVNAWTSSGLEGGDVARFGVDPLAPAVVYAATLNGAFKTTDRGLHWQRVSAVTTGAVAPHPTLAGVVFLADRYRQIHKSTDGGATWPLVGSGVPSLIYGSLWGGFTFWPLAADTVFYYRRDGIYRTVDGGATWMALGLPAQANDTISMVVDPNAGAPLLYLSTNYGVWKSTNGALSWQPASAGLPVDPSTGRTVVRGLAFVPGTPPTLLATHGNGRVYASTNGGVSWQQRSSGPVDTLTTLVPVGEGSPTVYAVGGDYGGDSPSLRRALWVSPDLGASWSLLATSYKLSTVAVDPQTPSFLYASMAEGVYVSADSGLGWSPANVGLRAMEFDGIAFRPDLPSTFHGHGSSCGIFVSTDGGATFANSTANLLDPVNGAIAIDPNDPAVLLSAGSAQLEESDPTYFDFLVRSDDGGGSWSKVVNLDGGTTAWYLQPWGLVALATIPTTWFAGSPTEGVFASTDGGASFSYASVGLPAGIWVTDLVTVDAAGSALYVTGETGVFVSTDGAATWMAASNGLPAGQVHRLAVDPTTPATLYAATAAGVYKTTDGGGLWSAIVDGWPLGTDGVTPAAARAIVVDPTAPDVLYASTVLASGAAVLTSRNGGVSWWPLLDDADLGVAAVWRLVLDPGDSHHLLAAARGGLYETRLDRRRLEVGRTGAGAGVVSSVPGGIACGASCYFDFAVGEAVTLEAAPLPGSIFTGWSGACSGLGACLVAMSEDRIATATFALSPHIFSDGFESGDVSAWDAAVGGMAP